MAAKRCDMSICLRKAWCTLTLVYTKDNLRVARISPCLGHQVSAIKALLDIGAPLQEGTKVVQSEVVQS
jgi:hypothetical protein